MVYRGATLVLRNSLTEYLALPRPGSLGGQLYKFIQRPLNKHYRATARPKSQAIKSPLEAGLFCVAVCLGLIKHQC